MFYIFAGKLIFRRIEIDFSEWVNMREPWQRRGTGGGSRGLTLSDGAGVSGCWRTISHFTYEMVYQQGKLPWMAILGSPGQDALGFRPVRFETIAPFH